MAQQVDPGPAQRAPTGYQKPAGTPAPGRGAGGVVGTSRRQGSRLTPYLFIAPYLVLFFTFVLLPAVYGIWISLHDWDFTLPRKPFVGLGNFTGLLHADYVYSRPFWDAMKATGIFTLFSVPLLLAVPLLVALVMNQRFRGRNFFRALYFAPYVLGVAVVS